MGDDGFDWFIALCVLVILFGMAVTVFACYVLWRVAEAQGWI